MNSSALRWRARQSLKNDYWQAVLVAFIASIFGALLANGGDVSINIDTDNMELLSRVPDVIKVYASVLIGTAGTLSLVKLVLGGVVQLGYSSYLLKQHDGQISSVKELFSKFDYFKNGFLQALLRGIFIFLWSLLFVVPGIVKALAYSMTPFLMAENPELTAREAMRLSEEKMQGHKWELFCMEFSFIGWYFLALLTLGIGCIFLNPYTNAAYAAFYREKIAPRPVIAADVIPEPEQPM